MSVAKLSVSIPEELAGFIENYRKKRRLTRSQVFEEAVKLLRSRELEAAYREANGEADKEWENAAADGLTDEAW
ncbi:MAG: ribbon-helix-helix protein, CopG family [Deltaproteobacteria bacterium]|nr:ribbon-helix-helix protein, CopG family [Deltaproteobacteria bacterium]